MPPAILLCTDGSDDAVRAMTAGLDLVGRDGRLVLVTVTSAPDSEVLVGSGHAGAELTMEEYDQAVTAARQNADSTITGAKEALGIPDADVRLLQGDPGPAICQLATELSAKAIVIGSRGRGRFRRALLGSVSDHVIRHAPCSVIVTGAPHPGPGGAG